MIAASLIALTITPLTGVLPNCEQQTGDYSGEENHIALSQGRIACTEWWAGDGQSEDLVVLDCETGMGFAARTMEVSMTHEPAFDHRFEAWDVLAEIEGSGFLLTIDQMADRFDEIDAPTRMYFTTVACGCEALEGLE